MRALPPAPNPMAIGRLPISAAMVVIMIGRKRTARLVDRLFRRQAALALRLDGEVDHHDGVFSSRCRSTCTLRRIIMLVGIVKKNAIMMIDFAIEAQRKGGLPPEQAIYQAGLVRFRPIMMTTMAALMGSLPIAIGFGAGAARACRSAWRWWAACCCRRS